MRLETLSGASLRIQAIETLSSVAALERWLEQVVDVLARDLPLSVTVENLGTEAETSFGQICGVLKTAIDIVRVDASLVSIAIDATVLVPQLAWLLRCRVLGPGPLYLLVDSTLTPPSAIANVRERQEKFWLQCWHLRESRQLRIALAPIISSPCPLLSSESARGILPPSGLQIPPDTAWIQMQLNLTNHVNARGEFDDQSLHKCLRHCIELGESMHDESDWPTAAMRHDAWLNRRLAISVVGIGDLANLRRLDPGCFRALKDLGKVLQDVRDVVDDTSRRLASQSQPAPSLVVNDPTRSADWQARWQKALEFAAMRHRNLLAISPWAMFPSTTAADSRYCDLLPLLEYADACSFPSPPCIRGWKLNEFKYFHHRVAAVLGTKDARQLIAEQV